MFPKVSRALSRFLEPLKPIARPGEAVSMTKAEKGEDGGHGALGYQAPDPKKEEQAPPVSKTSADDADELEPALQPKSPEIDPTQNPGFQPGLTQVILELNASRREIVSGTAVDQYESGQKEQKTGTKLPKGSMLDKKAG